MTRAGIHSTFLLLLVLVAGEPFSRAATTNREPDFQEVYDLVRKHLPGATDAEMNRAAVEGFLTALGSRASLGSDGGEGGAAVAPAELVSRASVLEGEIGYLRVGRVGDGLSQALASAHRELSGTNRLSGVVLDLRYAGGDDYGAAAAAADVFIAKAGPLLDAGGGMMMSKEKAEAIRVPVAVLVNGGTTGAAEALAAMLREVGAALILGNRTAGRAMVAQGYRLTNGQELRIATTPVRLGSGAVMPASGVRPDIEVAVGVEDEKAFYADPFLVWPRTNGLAGGVLATNEVAGTNVSMRRHFNEADLVRERRERRLPEGVSLVAVREREVERPVVGDPVLSRALDLLKGLAVVGRSRP